MPDPRATRRPARRATNDGQTRLRRRWRPGCPMQAYDALPAPLRAWLAQAARPWSAASVLAIWRRLRRQGATEAQILARLDRAQARSLARDRPLA